MSLIGHDNYQKVFDNDGNIVTNGARSNKRLSMIKWKPLFEGKRVLDIGCNSGMLSLAAKEAGAEYVLGIDAKPVIQVAQEMAKRRNLDVDFRAMDMESAEFKKLASEGFEITFFCAMYNHVKPENRKDMIQFIDGITVEVLFFETNFEHHPDKYTPILDKYTTFDKRICLGKSGDRKPEDYTLFCLEKHRNEPLEANRLPIQEVPFDDVHFSTNFDNWDDAQRAPVQKRVDELKASMVISGQVKPCLVIRNTHPKISAKWRIKEGGKRYLALKQLGYPTIKIRDVSSIDFKKKRTDL